MQRDQGPPPRRDDPYISLVIPAYNEKESLPHLFERIRDALQGKSYEIIFVDDGSTDGTEQYLRELAMQESRVKALRFRRNFGKSAALQAGFNEARGEVIITMDADLQDDPQEIPRLVEALDKGYDLVSGWREKRNDPFNKTLPSELFNAVTRLTTKITLHDFNCGFKAYRRAVVQNLHIYGEQHRFIPVLAYWQGFGVGEIPLAHHRRKFGRSKFGMRRFLSGFLDLFTVLFLTRFRFKPLHVFGSMGLLLFLAGLGINLYLTWIKLQGEAIGTRPLLSLGILLLAMGIQIFGIGLLAEMITLFSTRESPSTRTYEVLGIPRHVAPFPGPRYHAPKRPGPGSGPKPSQSGTPSAQQQQLKERPPRPVGQSQNQSQGQKQGQNQGQNQAPNQSQGQKPVQNQQRNRPQDGRRPVAAQPGTTDQNRTVEHGRPTQPPKTPQQ
ncbi:MAG: glycosyltransferase [Chloroflexota bacterium]|nr:MAG: glycosyltransferase [Chloroflexota bacterium]